MLDSKHNKGNVVKVIAFFVILILLFALLSIKSENRLINNDRLVPHREKSRYRILREAANSIDILIVGDSLSYSSITPMGLWQKQGYTSYVCGQSGQKMWETEEMLRTALKTQNPRLVILETNTMFRKQEEDQNLNAFINAFLNEYVPVFRGHDVWKSWFTDREYIAENYKGYAFRCSINPYVKGYYMEKTDKKEKLPDTTLTHMWRIIKMCRENGAELLLVSTPSPDNYNYAMHNTLKEYASEHSLAYLNMNLLLEDIGIDWRTDSLDSGDHLNMSGAEKVTKYLGEYLSGHYHLSDHRGDISFAAWEKESTEYEEKKKLHLAEMSGGSK